ncbi:hypothetical protein B0H21DRAFT_565163 [Amylocystis lapponica]|nr:hypothetical protein B0H21DRAFT_565163 [Amylocystis lapponica]
MVHVCIGCCTDTLNFDMGLKSEVGTYVFLRQPHVYSTYILSCKAVNLPVIVLQILELTAVACFTALRLYSILSKSVRLPILILLLGLVPVAADIFSASRMRYSFTENPTTGGICDISVLISPAMYNKFFILSRGCLIASDALVVGIVWFKIRMYITGWKFQTVFTPLSQLLMHDGIIYFISLLVLNIMHMALWFNNIFRDLSIFSVPISSILMSRQMCNLRAIYLSPADDTLEGTPALSFQFASRLAGNLGQGITHGTLAGLEDCIENDNTDDDTADEGGTAFNDNCALSDMTFASNEDILEPMRV